MYDSYASSLYSEHNKTEIMNSGKENEIRASRMIPSVIYDGNTNGTNVLLPFETATDSTNFRNDDDHNINPKKASSSNSESPLDDHIASTLSNSSADSFDANVTEVGHPETIGSTANRTTAINHTSLNHSKSSVDPIDLDAKTLDNLQTIEALANQTPTINHTASNHSGSSADSIDVNIIVVDHPKTTSPSRNQTSRWKKAVKVDDGNLQIEFFDNDSKRNSGMSACLINLEDTIRMAEWLPYHYATLPLGSVVIALDPYNTERGNQRTLELINLWKDRIEITLWPDFFLPEEKRFRKKQSYVRERQVYFANRCLEYHQQQNRTWTLLTDNDEYFIFNYVHDDESLEFDHPGVGKIKVKQEIKYNRKNFMPLRKYLPTQTQSTVLEFIHRHEWDVQNNKISKKKPLPSCVRLPGIRYGGSSGGNDTLANSDIIEPLLLSTLRYIHHEKRQSKFSKVMIDVSKASDGAFNWTERNHARTIHNPNRFCGKNGYGDSGADYPSSLFRLNHYLGSEESYLERAADYRERSLDKYKEKSEKIKASNSNWDTDIDSWLDVFVRSVGGATEAKKLLAPLKAYQPLAVLSNNAQLEFDS